ncbi:MAG: T9SS type A sorting domain-containing protein [Flavobacteriales bacterium]|jgi:hypothetical protein|nr:T9SS type A sorting domain-containing protein [Flavobacteriales bacterium]MBK7942842.1 T9SS type A sorting domain-containing protein [Flavobacteriales bacterium]MBK9698756.1 T9SS type A sorting domain-containing protein [Flavobacteriales bacterium]
MRAPSILGLQAALLALSASAQQPDWLVSWPVNWNLNPSMPRHVLASSPGGQLMTARLDGAVQSFGMDVFGSVVVHGLDPGIGQPLWSCGLFPNATADRGAVDDGGNVYVAGRFMDDMALCDGSILGHTGTGLDVDLFLMKFDPSGMLIWKRNISVDQPDATMMAALAIDPNGDLWYATSDFILTRINRVDAAGNDAEQRLIDGGKTIGGMSFDPWGGLYVSGGTDNGGFAFGGLTPTLPINEPYLMFLCRFKPDGAGDWVQFAHDVTFQFPVVEADAFGHAYVAGSILDATVWGGLPVNGAEWVSAMFLAKADSTGQFLWTVESDTAGGPITGDVEAGVRGCLAVDGAGNPYLTGSVRGQVDWGNGVVSDAISLGLHAQTIVAFDANGLPQWVANSQSTGTLTTQTITGTTNGTLYFSDHTHDVFGFPPHQAGSSGAQSCILGRISNTSTGVPDLNGTREITAHPSPFTDAFALSPKPSGQSVVRVFDANGRLVHNGSYRTGLGQDWPAGLYAVEVRSGAGRSVVRVVKE